MNFNCDICDYSTNDKFNFSKHQKTKKHLAKSVAIGESRQTASKITPTTIPYESSKTIEKYTCQFCENIYTNACNLARHRTICAEKKKLVDDFTSKQKEYESIINELKEKLLLKDHIIASEIARREEIVASETARRESEVAHKEELVLIIGNENKNLRSILSSAGTIVEKSMSAFNYINTNYNEAPALKMIENVPALHLDLAKKKVVQRIINEYRDHTLKAFLGDLIIKNYKKEDSGQQAIWNSDVDRLTYMIRIIINKDKGRWEVDKRGIRTTEHVIQPILDYIKKQLEIYMKTCDVGKRSDETDKVLATRDKLGDACKIIIIIDNGTLAEDILKYIAPRLHVIKELHLIN